MFDEFRQYLIDLDKADHTTNGYLHDLSLFARWFEQANNGQPLSPQNLTPTDVRKYRQYLLVERHKPSTINRHLAAIRAYATWAKETRRVDYNPVNGVKSVDEQETAPKWLDKREQAALIREAERRLQAAAENSPTWRQAIRDKAILLLLLNTGLRVSELAALEAGDILLGERKGEIQVRAGKGTKARTIPLNATARKALQEWDAVRPEVQTRIVFVSQRGSALQTRAIQFALESLAKDAKVEGVTPHVLRHTFAKNLVDSGVSLEKVATLLGHSNLNTTRIYVTPGQQDLERAVKSLDD